MRSAERLWEGRRLSLRRLAAVADADGAASDEEMVAEEKSAAHRQHASDAVRQPRVLVVEDNESTLLLLKTLLQPISTVETATNGSAALEAARTSPFDLLLLDINLGAGPSGLDVMRSLRREPAYQNVPMAAITAFGLPSDRDRFVKVGFDDFLSKPFDPDDLLLMIERLLRDGTA